jgi:hypothetical protein
MIRHFFLDKTNTIIKNSERNLGLNPIVSLCYGHSTSKGLLHFDIEPIRELINDKTFANTEKLSFTLKMTNCFSVDGLPHNKPLLRDSDMMGQRATSFDLILYKLPRHFDAGRGYDYSYDFWLPENKSLDNEGSNWYCCKTGILWDGTLKPKKLKNVEGDIYTREFIQEQYEKYINGEETIIVGSQHFDFGHENLSIDITDYVFEALGTTNDSNYGLCLEFAPHLYDSESEGIHCVTFFDDNTNTFFHPYVEVCYNEYIKDDRESFTLGKEYKLYLYVYDDGKSVNLDNIPECSVNGISYEVKQSTKGVYYAIIDAKNTEMTPNTIEYDMWSNLALNGENVDDLELEFAVNGKERKLMIGSNSNVRKDLIPSIYGINYDETIKQGDVREITVDFREKYSTDKKELIDGGEYRVYIKDGNRELNVINYQPIERGFLNNFFVLYTEDFIPNQYYVDVKVSIGRETKFYKEALRFKVVSNVTERYE